jgi:alanine racemase
MAMVHLDRIEPLAWVEVDIEAVRHNFRELKKLVKPPTQCFAVVKADAYGHGATKVAVALLQEGATKLCVARAEEAADLRNDGIDAPILVFAPPLEGQAHFLVNSGCECVVCDAVHIENLASAARLSGKKCRVHLKVDVGMGRLGVPAEDALEFARLIMSKPELILTGVMSHFPCADMPARTLTLTQIERFRTVRQTLAGAGIESPIYHIANSAALLDYPEAHFDAVRPGISLYGQLPSLEVNSRPPLKPAMTMKSRIVFLKEVQAGTGLSYGHTYVTTRPSRIATVALGYADGYPRHASNKTRMLVRGKEVPQVGRVCMDLSLIDVTDLPDVKIGDEVVAFGRQGNAFLPAEHVARDIGTIGYELTTRYGKRLPRIFVS